MARQKKNKKSFHLRIDPTVIERTAEKASNKGLDTSAYIEQLCRENNEKKRFLNINTQK
ncbi:hypothetical protein [Priestia megaterium]|uniref:hypothetical protein n=1 Tax=Priestia megaterium TaxID=1404 RepID=UPI0031FBA610